MLPRLKIKPLTLAHGVLPKENLKWPISGRNALAYIFEIASRMTKPIEMLLAGVLVAVVLIGTYAISNYFSRRRVEKDFKNPDDILTAVDVYLRYGRKRAAMELLQHGLERYPAHAELQAKLAEIEDSIN